MKRRIKYNVLLETKKEKKKTKKVREFLTKGKKEYDITLCV